MNKERAYFLDIYVAGRLYGDADLAWDSLKVGQEVTLVREPDNDSDPSAIALYVNAKGSSLKLGYVPLRKNQPLALFIDMGWGEAFLATISRLDPTAPYDRQIGVTLRLLRNDNRQD